MTKREEIDRRETETPEPRNDRDAAFADAIEDYRGALRLHCYRMLGSLHDAEDAVQDAFLRAWRSRESFEDGAPVRPWLFRIATNVCLNTLTKGKRRGSATATTETEVTWLQPFPEGLIDEAVSEEQGPDAQVIRKETVELAFMTAIQLLTPLQRATLILREVLGWSAKEAAELLETSVPAVNAALQRARSTLREKLPARRPEWPAGEDPDDGERELVRRYVAAAENADTAGFAALIRDDVTFRMPPEPGMTVGRDAMIQLSVDAGFGTGEVGRFRCLVTRANRQPAVACYTRREGETAYLPMAVDVLRFEEGKIAEIIAFPPDTFDALGLPARIEVGGA